MCGDDFMDFLGYMIVNGEFDEDRGSGRRGGSSDEFDDEFGDEFDDSDDGEDDDF